MPVERVLGHGYVAVRRLGYQPAPPGIGLAGLVKGVWAVSLGVINNNRKTGAKTTCTYDGADAACDGIGLSRVSDGHKKHMEVVGDDEHMVDGHSDPDVST